MAARKLILRLFHLFELLFSDNVSSRLFRKFFTQSKDTWFIDTDQGNTNTATKERV